ncbi:MAG TPA: transposase [Ktedonobacteraceae bacterium]|jgi:transposase|nr:transposase [Ktedonobacteraceae bacterium]
MQKKARKQYTAEFKTKVVKEILKEEKSVGQLAAEYEVHNNMLYRCRDQGISWFTGSVQRANRTETRRKGKR